MKPCPCDTPCPPRAPKRRPLAAPLAILGALALLCSATAALAAPDLTTPALAALAEDDRGLAPAPGTPVRYVIVKAVGQGVSAAEAEQDALRSVRLMAAKHYASLGGAAALDASPQGLRILGSHSSLPMGLTAIRSVVLVELRLRPMPEPPPAALALPVLRMSVDPNSQVQVEATRPCEVLIALDSGSTAEPEILPGGTGAVYRLAPGRPMRQALPQTGATTLRALACTGGLMLPSASPSVDEAFAKARPGKSRPATLQGVVSECVEIQTPLLPGKPGMVKRSMRAKGSEAPVNMTGVAGREGGMPVAKEMP